MSRNLASAAVLGLALLVPLTPADPQADLERGFTETVKPFVESYCAACHSGSAAAAQFDLRSYSSLSRVVADIDHWSTVKTRLSTGSMPPKAMKQPDPQLRQQVIAWIDSVRTHEARKNAGDP